MKSSAIFSFSCICLFAFAPAIYANDRLEFFETRIRPTLASHCLECHGPQKAESDLRLDHISFLTAEGSYGPVLVPGQPKQSSLYVSLTHANKDLMMPLEREKLAERVIADFEKWIVDGAFWPNEPIPAAVTEKFDLATRKNRFPWIWQTPEAQTIPKVENTRWPRGGIDHFVLAHLESAGLTPAPDAAPETWFRRVHFAITGLPPQPEQVQEFLADTSDQNREAVVDRLLKSPHFGERWARHWMDLVRYAESRGHESDFAIANAWHYRDYLIRALNEDVPFDQFVIEHIAGDLLPSPRINQESGFNESILATAWPFFGEEVHSPVDIRQDECDRIDNKIDVFSKTFLGLTVACARCHDHKFDAISQQDYYSLAGFFLSSHFRQVRFQTSLRNGRIADELESLYQDTQQQLIQWIADRFRPHLSQAAALYRPSTDPQHVQYAAAEVILDFSDPNHTWQTSGNAFGQSARQVGDLIIPNDSSTDLQVRLLGAAERDPIWNSLKLSPGNEADSGSLNAVGRAAGLVSTPTFVLNDGRVHVFMQGETQVYAAVDSHLMITGPLHKALVKTLKAPQPKWLTLDLRGYQGHRLHLEFGPVGDAPLSVFQVVQGPTSPRPTSPRTIEPGKSDSVSKLENEQLLGDAVDALEKRNIRSWQHAAAISWLCKNAAQIGVDSSFAAELKKIVANYQSRRQELAAQIQTDSLTAIALMDGSGVNERILKRGKHQTPGEVARRQLPGAFPFEAADLGRGSGRLQLAHQLIDPDNPLTARVIVNRIWHHLLGRGIVASVDNFGWLGSRPTHPELLDDLAYQFVHQDHWSIKTMIKRIVLSRTFAMSSRPDDLAAEKQDPNNLFVHRMNV